MRQERAMRLPRMTTRRWMVLVLAIALSIECGRWGWRMSRANRLTAAHHADQERIARLGMMQSAPPSRPNSAACLRPRHDYPGESSAVDRLACHLERAADRGTVSDCPPSRSSRGSGVERTRRLSLAVATEV